MAGRAEIDSVLSRLDGSTTVREIEVIGYTRVVAIDEHLGALGLRGEDEPSGLRRLFNRRRRGSRFGIRHERVVERRVVRSQPARQGTLRAGDSGRVRLRRCPAVVEVQPAGAAGQSQEEAVRLFRERNREPRRRIPRPTLRRRRRCAG